MTRSTATVLAVLALTSYTCTGFVAPSVGQHHRSMASPTFIGAVSIGQGKQELPYFIDLVEKEDSTVQKSAQRRMVAPKKTGGAVHKVGVFSPIVFAAKGVVGESLLNTVRGKVIGLHSEVIGAFVDTHETPMGQVALKALFQIADKDKNGAICEQELAAAVGTLGFSWLEEKQIKGIFARADKNGNGVITYDEFEQEAPKTLRTNLVKLAKKNGGDMGLLV